MTESEYPLIADSNLVNDMLANERIHDTIECCRIHLFCFYEELLEFSEGERSCSLELFEDVTAMDRREHISNIWMYSI